MIHAEIKNMAQWKEVAPNIFRITQKKNFKQMNLSVNIYVLTGENGLVFDSGFGNRPAGETMVTSIKQITKAVRDKGLPCSIKNALASHGHWDHFSGMIYLQKHLGIQILATEMQAPKLQSKAVYKQLFWATSKLIEHPSPSFFQTLNTLCAQKAKDIYLAMLKIKFIPENVKIINAKTKFTINEETWEMIHLPGHCDDDVVLYNRNKGIVLAGDIILNSVTTWLGPPKSRLDRYLETLEFLKNLPKLNLIFPAHGSPITAPRERIQEAIDHRQKRTQEIFQLVSEAGNCGISFEKIFKRYYPKSKPMQGSILRGWIIVTLEYLLEKGKIISTPRDRKIIFKINNALRYR